jgi:hypothetical protein
MNAAPCLLAAAALVCVAAGARAAAPDTSQAAERCEGEVADTIKRMRGKDVAEVQFTSAARVLSPTVDDEVGVRGEGRYRGAAGTVPFSYSCAYNAGSGATSGVVFRETGPARDGAAWQPDLTHVSPEACESAVAAALKDKHPRVGRIVFGSESRRLQPVASARIGLEGQGAVQRAPGMNAVPFTYRCEIDPRNGAILQAQAQEAGDAR